MKKFILLLITLLAAVSNVKAQDLTVANFEVPQNSDGTLTVNFQFDAADKYTSFEFKLELPSEFSFEMGSGTAVKFEKGDCYNESHSVTANLSEGLVKVACLSTNSDPFSGTSGVLLKFKVHTNSELQVGKSYSCKIKDKLITPILGTKVKPAESTFTITIGEPADLRTVLDETSTTAPVAATNVDVRVKKTIKAGTWSTICLPFAMSAAQVTTAFGSGVQLGDFAAWSSEEDDEGDITSITVEFNEATAIEANHPYIIKVSEQIDEFTVDGVDIAPEEEPYVQVGSKKVERGFFPWVR